MPDSRVVIARWVEQAEQPDDQRVFIAVLNAAGCLEVTVEAAERR